MITDLFPDVVRDDITAYEYNRKLARKTIAMFYKCELPEVTSIAVEAPMLDSAAELTEQESSALQQLFLVHNLELQQAMCYFFHGSYPVVCDIGVDLVSSLSLVKLSDLFDVYCVTGGYDVFGPGSYHAWNLLVGKQSGAACYVDLTYQQFPKSREDAWMLNFKYDVLREFVSRCPDRVEFPAPVVRLSSAVTSKWMPQDYYTVCKVGA